MIVNALLWAADVVLAAVHIVFLAATVYLAPPHRESPQLPLNERQVYAE